MESLVSGNLKTFVCRESPSTDGTTRNLTCVALPERSSQLVEAGNRACDSSRLKPAKINLKKLIPDALSHIELRELQPFDIWVAGTDPMIVVSDNLVIATVGNSMAIYRRRGMKLINKFAFIGKNGVPGIWTVEQYPVIAGLPIAADASLVWDDIAKRFWMVALSVSQVAGRGTFYIAVSKTATPSSATDFHTYLYFTSLPSDYPTIAVDADAVYIASTNAIVVFNKQTLLNGPSDYDRVVKVTPIFSRVLTSYRGAGYTYAVQPTPGCDGFRSKVIMLQTTDKNTSPNRFQTDFINVFWIDDVLTTPVWRESILTFAPYSTSNATFVQQKPPTENIFNVPLANIRVGHGRMVTSRPQLYGDQLWFVIVVYDDNLNDGIDYLVVRWYQANVSNLLAPLLIQEGVVDVMPNHVMYAAVNVNREGHMGMVLSVAGPTAWPTILYTGRLKNDPPGTVRLPLKVASGGDLYHQNSFQRIPTNTGNFFNTTNRGGESLGLATDPKRELFYFSALDPQEVPITIGDDPYSLHTMVTFTDQSGNDIASLPDMAGLLSSNSPFLSGPLTLEVILANPANVCTTITNNLTGKIAVVEFSSCANSTTLVQRAFAAGASAVILANVTTGGTFAGATGRPNLTIIGQPAQFLLNYLRDPNSVPLVATVTSISNFFESGYGSTVGVFDVGRC